MYYLIYDKPRGVTSFEALYPLKRALGTAKVGHTGTLDKFASGLLAVLTGRALKLSRFFTNCDKRYIAEVRFGLETDTLDPEGRVIAEAPPPGRAGLEAVLNRFRGPVMQAPPEYSAIHVGGKRAHKLARAGADMSGLMVERPVTIHSLDLLSYEDEAPGAAGGGAAGGGAAGGITAGAEQPAPPAAFGAARALIAVHCSSGVYIRSLARDIARFCGSRAYLTGLRRTAVGGFRLDEPPAGAAGAGAAGGITAGAGAAGGGAAFAEAAGGGTAGGETAGGRAAGGIAAADFRPPDVFCFEKLGIPVLDVDKKIAAALKQGRPPAGLLGETLSGTSPLALFNNNTLAAVIENQNGKWVYAFVNV